MIPVLVFKNQVKRTLGRGSALGPGRWEVFVTNKTKHPPKKHKTKKQRDSAGIIKHNTHFSAVKTFILQVIFTLGQHSDTQDIDHHGDHSGSPALEICVQPGQQGSRSRHPAAGWDQLVDRCSPHVRLILRSGTCACQSVLPLPLPHPASRRPSPPQAPLEGPGPSPPAGRGPGCSSDATLSLPDSGTQEGRVSGQLLHFPHLWAR